MRSRGSFEANLTRVKGYRRDRVAPRCYISHAGDRGEWVGGLLHSLRDAGVLTLRPEEDPTQSDFVLIVWTRAYHKARDSQAVWLPAIQSGPVPGSAAAPVVLRLLVDHDAATAATTDDRWRGYQTIDFREETRHVIALFDLVLTIYAIPLDHAAFEPLRKALWDQWKQAFSASDRAASSASKPTTREVFISYAWEDESERMVSELDRALQSRGVRMVRDKHDLGFKGDIRAFMEGIGRGRCVVLILSDKYLQSENCLYELLQIEKYGDLTARIFPVVLESARIYKPLDRIRYVQYWEKQVADLDAALKTVSAANLQGFRQEIDLYAEIRAALPRLADILKNLNTLTPNMHRESGFTKLIDGVIQRLEND